MKQAERRGAERGRAVDERPDAGQGAVLPWHATAWAQLCARADADRLPHGLLLVGPAGSGRRRFADAFAAWLLCGARTADAACGRCRSCVQWQAGSHPDAMLVQPDAGKRDIRIEQVRELLERLTLTRHYGGHRVIRLVPAEALNGHAANALLKTLEEPPPGTVFLFISELPRSLPATVRSRMQHLRLPPPSREQALDWLGGQGVESAETRLDAAGGAVLNALTVDDRTAGEDFQALLEQTMRRDANPLEAVPRIGTTRDSVGGFLGWFSAWCHRQLLAADIDAAARLELMLRELVQARRALDGNAHPQLLLESVLIAWHRVHHARLPAFIA